MATDKKSSAVFCADDIKIDTALRYLCCQFPMHKAAEEGNAGSLEHLIDLGYSINKQTYDLVSPLHVACFYGHAVCAEILIKRGAFVNITNIDGATPLCEASCNGNADCVAVLLKHGANPNPPLTQDTPLHEAVLRDNVSCVELLVSSAANVNSTNCYLGTPLHIAAYKCFIRSARILINAGANVNVTKNLHTPLHDVAHIDESKFVSLLLDAGANVYAKDNSGLTARDLAPRHSKTWKLLKHWESANVNVTKNLHTPLHDVAHIDESKFVSLLLDAGANVYAKDNSGLTARDLAPRHSKTWKLLKHWESANVNVTKNLHTPLHDVAHIDESKFVSLLLDAGANVYAKDNSGLTARDLAPRHSKTWKLLKHWETNPRPLGHFCRIALNKWLQSHKLTLSQVHLPASLVSYMRYEEYRLGGILNTITSVAVEITFSQFNIFFCHTSD